MDEFKFTIPPEAEQIPLEDEVPLPTQPGSFAPTNPSFEPPPASPQAFAPPPPPVTRHGPSANLNLGQESELRIRAMTVELEREKLERERALQSTKEGLERQIRGARRFALLSLLLSLATILYASRSLLFRILEVLMDRA